MGSKKKTKVAAVVEVVVSTPSVEIRQEEPAIEAKPVSDPSLGRLQIQAVKIATLSEIVWFGSKVLDDEKVMGLVRKMLVTMDWPDGWWRKRVNTTIGEWIKFLQHTFEFERAKMERREEIHD